jgi:hypothetical protein
MKKEELIKRLYTHKIIGDKDLMQILEEAGFKDYAISSIINKIADIINAPLHPAEGAVPDNAAEQNKRMREWFKERTGLDDTLLSIHMEQIDVMLKGIQQQPTAEGAEEILANHIDKESMDELSVNVWLDMLEAMQEYATLHAQRIAEKMVSERLREELIAYKTYENIFDNKFTTVEDLIDEYLKTRER